MSLTSRQKRPLDRRIPHLRDTCLVVIAAEGAKKEKRYFECEAFQRLRVQVRVLPAGSNNLSSPRHVLERLRKFAREVELQPGDQLWLALDVDRWEKRALAEVCRLAGRHKALRARSAISNPCFELWLHLHYADWTTGPVSSSADMKRALDCLCHGHDLTALDGEAFVAAVDQAAVRARRIDVANGLPWPDNPGTRVYHLVEAIRSLHGM